MNNEENLLTDLRGANPTPVQDIIDSHLEIDRPDVESLKEEDLLDLTMAEMSREEADLHADACARYLTLKGNPVLRQNVTSVEATLIQFKKLLVEATKKRIGNDRYITALSITLGVSGNDFKPVFRPVYLRWLRYDAETQKDLYHAAASAYGNYYKFDAGGFQPISKVEGDRMVSEYKSNIKIVHKNGDSPQPFLAGVDVESVLIPLQTIYTVICSTTDYMGYITQAVRSVQYDAASPIKHIVMVSGDSIALVDRVIIYANRSHLCPPCSTIFGFDLA